MPLVNLISLSHCALPATLAGIIRRGVAVGSIFFLILTAACTTGGGKVSQFATLSALMDGVYDSEFTCAEVARRGDLGLGTFERLDGEMVVVDGTIYQVTIDGSVHRVPGAMRTPFATVTRFRPEQTVKTTSAIPLAGLEAVLDHLCPDPDAIYAFRIRGEFPIMKTRSVPPQSKPYPRLLEVVKMQTVFALGPVRGTLVGFRFPQTFAGINAPGYHFHFLADDRASGGHVLDLTAASGLEISLAPAPHYELFLPAAITPK